jgi:translation initiation factor IF-1
MPDRMFSSRPDPRRSGDGEEPADTLQVNARVLEGLPNALFRVELEAGSRRQATVHLAAGSGLLRVLPGDVVVVELAPYDRSRGRIVRRLPPP